MDTEANKAVVRHILENLRPGNLAVLEAHPGYWQTREVFPATFAAFPDFRMTVERQIAEGDEVATFATCRGTHLGEFLGIPPTGKEVSFQSMNLDHVVDGKVVQHNGEAGWFSVFLNLGALPLKREG